MIRTPQPVVDETGFTGNVDISFRPVFKDMDLLGEELKKSGLQLIKGRRTIKMMVIKDRN